MTRDCHAGRYITLLLGPKSVESTKEEGDHRQPLAFFSKALQPTEQRYSTFGRELLAAYLSVQHFRHYAEGGRLIIFTDH